MNIYISGALLASLVLHPISAVAENEAQVQTYLIGAVKWPYKMFQRAESHYVENREKYAPHSTLRFKLPSQLIKHGAMQPAVRVLNGDVTTAAEVAIDGTFALPHPASDTSNNASLVVDGYFNPGHHYLPPAVVRTAGLSENALRLGDLRLGCEVTLELLRGSRFSMNMLFGLMKGVSLNPCKASGGYTTQAPVTFNKVTYLNGSEILQTATFPASRTSLSIPVENAKLPDSTVILFELAEGT